MLTTLQIQCEVAQLILTDGIVSEYVHAQVVGVYL